LYQYAFQYSDVNRAKLKSLKSWQQIDKYLDSQQLIKSFVFFVNSKGLASNWKEINISKNTIIKQLKAYITRNTLGDEGFYPILYKDDKTVLMALEQLRKK